MRKPQWGELGDPRHLFDHFVFRNDVATTSNWNTAGIWKQAGTNTNVDFYDEDSYANAILEFTVRNDASYTAANNMVRMTNQTFMLNEIRLTGNFTGSNNHSGTINGNALLFVSNLDGQLPRLQLDATSNGTGTGFAFVLNNQLWLLNDLEITGDGTQSFTIGGNIYDYPYEPKNIVKTGTSSVTLAGSNTFLGDVVVIQGRVTASNLAGGVIINGGEFAAGASAALTAVGGDLDANTGGTLALQIGGDVVGTEYDKVAVAGSASLGGTLSIELINGFSPELGQTFQLITAAGGMVGSFDSLLLPALADGMWHAVRAANSFSLAVTVEGDYDGNGIVDSSDYVFWQKFLGTEPAYNAWREHFGQSIAFSGPSDVFSVPEPSGLLFFVSSMSMLLSIRRRPRKRAASLARQG